MKTFLCVINIVNKVTFNWPKQWSKFSWYKEYRDKNTVDWQGSYRACSQRSGRICSFCVQDIWKLFCLKKKVSHY